MTQDELDAIPEIGQIVSREEIRDGQKVIIPICLGRKVLWTPANEPTYVVDQNGVRWNIGYHNGARYKQRMWSL